MQMMMEAFKEHQALWVHDGNPHRPYVRLRSGLISNAYFNAAKVYEHPAFLRNVITEFMDAYRDRAHYLERVTRVVGPAVGGIPIATLVATYLEDTYRHPVLVSYAEKSADGFDLSRLPPHEKDICLRVEDTMTTGGSLTRVMEGVERLHPDKHIPFVPLIFCLCNRTGKKRLNKITIASVVELTTAKTWKDGKNPFTLDGKELVPPVTDVKRDWAKLHRSYPV